jgi:hypothetical protein
MLWKENIHAQEQFLHLENYRSEWDSPKQLEIFPEEVKAEIVNILDAKPEDISSHNNEIEPIDSRDM